MSVTSAETDFVPIRRPIVIHSKGLVGVTRTLHTVHLNENGREFGIALRTAFIAHVGTQSAEPDASVTVRPLERGCAIARGASANHTGSAHVCAAVSTRGVWSVGMWSRGGDRSMFETLRRLAGYVLVFQLSLLIAMPCAFCAVESPVPADDCTSEDGDDPSSPARDPRAAAPSRRSDHDAPTCCCGRDPMTVLTGSFIVPPALFPPSAFSTSMSTSTLHFPASQAAPLDPSRAPDSPPPRFV